MTSAESKILFSSSGWLWTVRADGTEHTRLDGLPSDSRSLMYANLWHWAWSSDGRRIVLCYCGMGGPGGVTDRHGRLFLVDADGSNLVDLAERAGPAMPHHVAYPAWSPDGSRLAFVGSPGGASITPSALWSMGADGTSPKPLLDIGLLLREPMWSPDGSRIAFLATCYESAVLSNVLKRGVDYSDYLHVADADGSNQRRLCRVHGIYGCRTYSWSPNGERITFADECELHLINADGTNRTQLTRAQGRSEQPWNPAGDSRASTAGCDGGPAWSPDSSRIAFVSTRTGCSQIYTVAPDGTDLKPLTHGFGGSHGPLWSRDGRRIAFVSQRAESVWVMDADGSNQLCVSREQRPCDAPDIF